MGPLEKLQNRRRKWKSSHRFSCSECKYTSNRLYNVIRHEFRIHSPSTKPRQCCGELLASKGQYYMHCEEIHPNSRLTNIMSRKKYKIFPKIKISESIPYMLRSRVRPEDFAQISSQREESVDETNLEDILIDNRTSFQESSGYETKSSENSTTDPEEASPEIQHLNLKKRDARKALQLFRFDDTSKTVVEESSMPTLIEFSKNERTTAGLSGNSASGSQKSCDKMNLISPERITDVKHKELDESSHITGTIGCYEKNVRNEPVPVILEETKPLNVDRKTENNWSGALSNLNPYQLPPKKRILFTSRFFNRENIANATEPIGDRLRPAKPLQVEQTPNRTKRLSKKMKRRSLRKGINTSRHPSTSSDQENIPPLTTNTLKEKIVGLRVDLHAFGKSTWEQITVEMRERLGLIDFDSFK